MTEKTKKENLDFVRQKVERDLETGKYTEVVTRFPPEPNGYLHVGHSKAICLDFGLVEEYGGRCHLRMDDTDPSKESYDYVEAIKRDIQWLGFDWGEHLYFASDYFEKLYEHAVALIREGKAYVDSLDEEAMREYRGTITEAGKPSPYRERSVEENLDLFARMRAGEFPDGAHVLRLKIGLDSPNMKMRDPAIYRIRHHTHYRQGDAWCIYPLYDFTHCLSDAIEGVTHSLCTLEFQDNRELYDWVLDNTDEPARPEQTEFARLNLNYTVMSKRKLLRLVEDGHVDGWDDPRMPTLSGMRRRGYTPEAIRKFVGRIGLAKANSVVDFALLEHTLREDLNERCPRVMCVLDPIEVVVESYAEGDIEQIDADHWPEDIPKEGSRKVPFSRRLFIERDDFRENPPPGWHRLAPGAEVRLRYAYVVRCERVEKNDAGQVVRVICSHDPDTLDASPRGRKVRGTIHWVSADESVPCEVRRYDRLFQDEFPGGDGRDFLESLNPDSLDICQSARVEPSLKRARAGDRFQFERQGFYFVDPASTPEALVFNQTVALRDSWAKAEKRSTETDSAAVAVAPAARELNEKYGVSLGIASKIAADPRALALFGPAVEVTGNPAPVADEIASAVLPALRKQPEAAPQFDGSAFGEFVRLKMDGTLFGDSAAQVFSRMWKSGVDPKQAAQQASGVFEVDAATSALVDRVMTENGDLVHRYRAGETKLLGVFVGKAMKSSRGKADASAVNRALRRKLAG